MSSSRVLLSSPHGVASRTFTRAAPAHLAAPSIPFARSGTLRARTAILSSPAATVPVTSTEPKRRISRSVSDSAPRAKPAVLVAEKLGEAGLDVLRQFADVECAYGMSPAELLAKVAQFDALIVRSGTKVTREVLEAGRGRLRVVGRAGVGIDNVDLQAATEAGCLVVNAPTANTVAAAEHGIALLACMARNVSQADAALKAGKWQRAKYVGVSLVGKTLAIMGFGKVGSEVARRAKGLGMHVIAHDPYAPADKARAIGAELVSFEEAIAKADFISLHMPLTPATSKVFNDESFGKMKTGVRIVNVARGGVIDEDALVRALDSGKVAQEGVAIEIAEAVGGALRGELAATAVNAPMVPAEVMSELAPYVSLAEKLGRLAVQLVAGESGIKGVKVVYTSARDPDDLDTRLLRAMITKGIVEPVSSTFVNLVNADYTAKQRGLRIAEERVSHDNAAAEAPLESIQVRLSHVQSRFAGAISDGGDIVVVGRVKYGVPHLTVVGAYEVDVSLEGNLILCRQVDQPGMIGKVGNILGEKNVNVSFMSVGRTSRGKQAIMAIGVDEEPDKKTLEKIGAIPAVEEFVFLEL
ncbi:hypothetical protein CFC21_002293 [Triticum aestivum]|uniref:phosphoglycerate dehydrogenase n=1 Tax=Triticum aestivum TaxID=4565 RepID=A0A3B5Y1H1_WHEAT|nr:D-3-phosphoglycerate dehydrogenase 2, chloroplastic-like isoform X2 [Triticum aestivum]KAF6984255.1 hypothetical protein CFC21_002293 [Triticum aestivum]